MKPKAHKTAGKKKDNTMHTIQNITLASGSDCHLTLREIQLMELVSNGLDIQAIADELFLSPNTVETHRRNIIKKLKANNMPQAISIAFRNKILK